MESLRTATRGRRCSRHAADPLIVWGIAVFLICLYPGAAPAESGAAEVLLAGLDGERRLLLDEVVERNPDIARAKAAAEAAALRAPQVRALPDPMLGTMLFVLPPETRVGPQRLSLSFQQSIPWLAKLDLRERQAVLTALMAAQEVERRGIEVVTEGRRLLDELWFVDRQHQIASEEQEHLVRHEEAARARYTAGKGLQQAVIKIQSEITRSERRLLELAARRRSLEASFNALRDEPAATPIPAMAPAEPEPGIFDSESLLRRALTDRPEMRRAALDIERHRLLEELALLDFKPDFNVGLTYTLVEGRDDPAGRANPPPDDGDDILALSGSLRLPRRKPRVAAQEEAAARRRAAEAGQRSLEASITAKVGDLYSRIPLLYDEWRLLSSVLLAQAEEALRSAESAYATGEVGALDLLDAEHVLFQVRTAAARVRADYSVALGQLEAVVAGPLTVEPIADGDADFAKELSYD